MTKKKENKAKKKRCEIMKNVRKKKIENKTSPYVSNVFVL